MLYTHLNILKSFYALTSGNRDHVNGPNYARDDKTASCCTRGGCQISHHKFAANFKMLGNSFFDSTCRYDQLFVCVTQRNNLLTPHTSGCLKIYRLSQKSTFFELLFKFECMITILRSRFSISRTHVFGTQSRHQIQKKA